MWTTAIEAISWNSYWSIIDN